MSFIDASLFLFLFFYFISIFYAVSARAALGEFLKNVTYLGIYFLVFIICRQKNLFCIKTFGLEKINTQVWILLHVLLVSGTLSAAAGLGHAAGIWHVEGGYLGGRIYSFFQYSNAAASYFMASYLLVLGLIPIAEKWFLRPVYMIPAVILFTGVLLTFSRGAWILLPGLILLLIIFSGPGQRLKTFLYSTATIFISLALFLQLDRTFQSAVPTRGILYILAAVFMGVITAFLIEYFLRVSVRQKLVFAGITAGLIMLTGFYMVFQQIQSPLLLGMSQGEAGREYFEQTVNIPGGESLSLSLQVRTQGENTDGLWGLVVSSYILDDQSTDFEKQVLLNYEEGVSTEWIKKEFGFISHTESEKLEIQLYSELSNTPVEFKEVILTGANSEIPLTFTFHRLLPHRLYNRLFSMSSLISAQQRFVHQRDALKIIRDYPLLGVGGGGWQALYLGYIDREYYTTEPHSHFLKVWLETGIPGFLSYLGIWVFFILAFICDMRNSSFDKEGKKLWTAVFLPALSLGLHSLIDFSLSLGSVSIYLFVLWGMGRSIGNFYEIKGLSKGAGLIKIKAVPIVVLAVFFILFLITFSLRSSLQHAEAAAARTEEGRLSDAVVLFEKAVSRDPLQAKNHFILGEIYKAQAAAVHSQEEGLELMKKALHHMQRSYELESFNPEYNRQYGLMLLQFGQIEEGLYYLDRLVNLNPFSTEYYIQAAAARISVGEYYLQAGQEEKAVESVKQIFSLQEKMIKARGNLDPLDFYLGQAHLMLEDFSSAEKYFSAVDAGDENYEKALYILQMIRGI